MAIGTKSGGGSSGVLVQGSTIRLAMTTGQTLTTNNTWQDITELSGSVIENGVAKFDTSIIISPHNGPSNAEVKVRLTVNGVEYDVKRWYRANDSSSLQWNTIYLKSPEVSVLSGQLYKVQVFGSSTIENGLAISGGTPEAFNSWIDYTKMVSI